MKNPDLLMQTAGALMKAQDELKNKHALLGFDGFVDEIVRVVDKRYSRSEHSLFPNIAQFAERILQAAGRSTNIELVVQKMKLGGNGPIMANALAVLGAPVTYIGNLGYPTLHPIFAELARRAAVISIADPCHTDALEFDDGKLMLGKIAPLDEITWENLMRHVGEKKFVQLLAESHLIGLVNWTMIPYMAEIWENMLQRLCPQLPAESKSHFVFFDLADPAKRLAQDIRAALEIIAKFQSYFQVILGTNEKESFEIAEVLGIEQPDNQKASMMRMAEEIRARLGLHNVVIHPVQYAVAASASEVKLVEGPWDPKPLISTGAGDHFNAGFCLGRLLGLNLEMSLLTGVTSSGFYVRTAQSPRIEDLIAFLQNWPD
ncbi:carbohydrate kinase family protein [candidate division KSB1 bacterium]|nr:carbohydrate kinase family protein [candidate division KSB1 bacterium]